MVGRSETLGERVAALKASFEERTKTLFADNSEMKADIKEVKGLLKEFIDACGNHRKEFNGRMRNLENCTEITKSKWETYGQIGVAIISTISAITAAYFAALASGVI